MEFQVFKNHANSMGVSVDNFEFSKLQVYFEFLKETNKKMNLTTITEEDDVFLLHFLDSLAAMHKIPQNASVCDVGTGAGFPGVVLKIFRPDIRLTLIDSLNKRITFLSELLEKLQLQANLFHMRAEDAARSDLRASFDIVVSRAVAKLNTLYEYTLPLVKIGGKFIAYKANCEDELSDSKNVPKILGAKCAETEFFTLSGKNVARSLIICEKIAPTPSKYPRGGNKERQMPLR